MKSRRLASAILIPLLLASLSACASNGFLMAKPTLTLYGNAYPPKADTASVEVFQSRLPDRPYSEIGRIEVADTDDKWSMQQILRKAREIGADAVIITGRTGTIAVGAPAYAVSEAYGLTAIAIRFKQ